MNIGYGLASSEIAEFAHFVVEILGVALEQDEVAHVVVPYIGVLAVLLGQRHGVEHVAEPGIVGGEDKLEPLVFVLDGREAFVE